MSPNPGGPINGIPAGQPGASTGYANIDASGGYHSDADPGVTRYPATVPLGNGLFYDPVSGQVVGGNSIPTGSTNSKTPGLQL